MLPTVMGLNNHAIVRKDSKAFLERSLGKGGLSPSTFSGEQDASVLVDDARGMKKKLGCLRRELQEGQGQGTQKRIKLEAGRADADSVVMFVFIIHGPRRVFNCRIASRFRRAISKTVEPGFPPAIIGGGVNLIVFK